MERIIERLKKIQALAERGDYGEAQNARRMLENELKKYGITLDELSSRDVKRREFSYGNVDDRTIFVQCLWNMFGHKSEIYAEATINYKARRIFCTMTDLEYVDFSSFYDFHRKQFRREKKKLMNDLIPAYVYKHGLFSKDPNDGKTEERDIDIDELLRINTLRGSLENVSYHKQIE